MCNEIRKLRRVISTLCLPCTKMWGVVIIILVLQSVLSTIEKRWANFSPEVGYAGKLLVLACWLPKLTGYLTSTRVYVYATHTKTYLPGIPATPNILESRAPWKKTVIKLTCSIVSPSKATSELCCPSQLRGTIRRQWLRPPTVGVTGEQHPPNLDWVYRDTTY